MGNLYEIIAVLCKERGVSPSRMCLDIGAAKSLMTELKSGRSKQLSLATATKIADYFEVPVDFLLQRPPFEYWDEINADRRGFIAATNFDVELLDLIWGIDPLNPYAAPVTDFVSFLNLAFLSAIPDGKGGWDIKLRGDSLSAKKAPTPGGERSVSDDDIKFALFGGDGEITDAMFDEVKNFAAFVKAREQEKKKE